MPSNFTQNYHLSQWKPTDSVLREDFNADNQKIDEVLARTDRRGIQVIKKIVTTEDTTFLTVDFSEIDWKEWKVVHIFIRPKWTVPSGLQFYYYGTESWGEIAVNGSLLSLFPMGRDDSSLSGIFWSKEPKLIFVSPILFKSFQSFVLRSPDSKAVVKAGTEITFYGEHM